MLTSETPNTRINRCCNRAVNRRGVSLATTIMISSLLKDSSGGLGAVSVRMIAKMMGEGGVSFRIKRRSRPGLGSSGSWEPVLEGGYLKGEGEWSSHDVNISPKQLESSDGLVLILERIKTKIILNGISYRMDWSFVLFNDIKAYNIEMIVFVAVVF